MNSKNTWLAVIGIAGIGCLIVGLYLVYRPTPQLTQSTSQTNNYPNPCQPIVYSPNVRWICGKPSYTVCPNLERIKSSVTINGDTAVIVVPADEPNGVPVTGFQINKGDKISISTNGRIKFSSDHPCVEADGMNGWEDLGIDSPFNHNVGGLEFSIGSLYENRYFAGKSYQATAETSGVPVFRVIESFQGYKDNNSGAFTVTLHKIK
jgi:hypothetical protein